MRQRTRTMGKFLVRGKNLSAYEKKGKKEAIFGQISLSTTLLVCICSGPVQPFIAMAAIISAVSVNGFFNVMFLHLIINDE